MREWEPEQWVALILAIVVLSSFFMRLFFAFIYPEAGTTREGTVQWLDILKYIVGGLIGYMTQSVKSNKLNN